MNLRSYLHCVSVAVWFAFLACTSATGGSEDSAVASRDGGPSDDVSASDGGRPDVPTSGCRAASDCDEGQACRSGVCRAECTPDCPTGFDCVAGACTPACTPSCGARACGADGCGGTCGEGCTDGEICTAEGRCIERECAPDCTDRECGVDLVCGLRCGECGAGRDCGENGRCGGCVPSCAARECGDDGCGGSCGSCAGSRTCGPEGRCGESLRPWDGPSASLRFINGDVFASSSSRTLCVYGPDDERPYAVLSQPTLMPGEVRTVRATYVPVPALVPLRVSHHFRVGSDPADPADCDPRDAVVIGSPTVNRLLEDAAYTLVVRTFDRFFTDCAAGEAPECGLFPRSGSGDAVADCTSEAPVLFTDGFRSGLTGEPIAYARLVNLTTNASRLNAASSPGSASSLPNRAGEGLVLGYGPPLDSATLVLCPGYLGCSGRLSAAEASEANRRCWRGGSELELANVENARLTSSVHATSVYVFGSAGRLDATGGSLGGNRVAIVVAHDESDGPLF